jgi:hypothetical protein
MRMRIHAFMLKPDHTFSIKKIKGQQVFDYGEGWYASEKAGVYSIRQGNFIRPVSVYRLHDPSAIGMRPPTDVATHVWRTRVLQQLGGGKRFDTKWLKWLVAGGIVAVAFYFTFA